MYYLELQMKEKGLMIGKYCRMTFQNFLNSYNRNLIFKPIVHANPTALQSKRNNSNTKSDPIFYQYDCQATLQRRDLCSSKIYIIHVAKCS